MNQNKLTIGLALASAALLAAVVSLALKPPVVVENKTTLERLSAFPGPDLNTVRLNVNGVPTSHQASNFSTTSAARTASSTLCVLPAPVATSTVSVRVAVTAPTTTPLYLVLEKNNIPFAPPLAAGTTTGEKILGIFLIPANNLGSVTVVASTTNTGGDQTVGAGQSGVGTVFGPNLGATTSQFLIAHLRNAGGGGLTQTGTGFLVGGSCKAEFKEF